MDNRDEKYARQIADLFIDLWNEPGEKYRDPFLRGKVTLFGQLNGTTGKQYSGANQALLSGVAFKNGWDGDRWFSMQQANAIGARVRKGSKATQIRYFTTKEHEIVADNGDKETRESRITRYTNMFHESQLEGLNKEQVITWDTVEDRHAKAEEIIAKSPVPVIHDTKSRAYYSVSKDEIHLPPREDFKSAGDFYATVLHELGHSTGHPSRLNRPMGGKHGEESYAREELRAEIASLMMAQRIGVHTSLGQHKAYVKSWTKLLEDKPNEILKACSDAERICHHLGIHAPEHEKIPVKTPSPEKEKRIAEGKAQVAKLEREHHSQAQSPDMVQEKVREAAKRARATGKAQEVTPNLTVAHVGDKPKRQRSLSR